MIWHQRLIALNVACILFLGALTTGAGPHSGDADATERLALDPELIARAHAGTVWLFLVLFGLLVWRVRRDHSDGARDEVRRAWMVVAAVTLTQGAIGYVQYFTGLPEWLVALHLVGLGAFSAAHSASHYLLKTSRTA